MIDYNTCTMRDVIARSVLMHPSMLADAMHDIARIHGTASDTMRFDREACCVAGRMSKAAWDVVELIRDNDLFDVSVLTFSQMVMTFGAAAKLQCLSRGVQNEIASREPVEG